VRKQDIEKAIKDKTPLYHEGTYGRSLKKVTVIEAAKIPTYEYGRLKPESYWPTGWKIEADSGEKKFVSSRELLGPYDEIVAAMDADLKRQRERQARETAERQRQIDAATKIKELFAAVGSETFISDWGGTITLAPTDFYGFLELLGKTTAKGIAATLREHFADQIDSTDMDERAVAYDMGLAAAIDYIEKELS
jgi:hypothetical protein